MEGNSVLYLGIYYVWYKSEKWRISQQKCRIFVNILCANTAHLILHQF